MVPRSPLGDEVQRATCTKNSFQIADVRASSYLAEAGNTVVRTCSISLARLEYTAVGKLAMVLFTAELVTSLARFQYSACLFCAAFGAPAVKSQAATGTCFLSCFEIGGTNKRNIGSAPMR